jgi:hypothetical protein
MVGDFNRSDEIKAKTVTEDRAYSRPSLSDLRFFWTVEYTQLDTDRGIIVERNRAERNRKREEQS